MSRPSFNVEGLGAIAGRLHRAVQGTVLQRLAERGFEGLTAGAATLMPLIEPQGSRPIILAERSGLTRQAVGQIIRELMARRFVEVAPDPSDARAKVVRVVGAGRALQDASIAALDEIYRRAGTVIGDDGVPRLEAAMSRLADAVAPG
ncbi:MarR family winged helix-turn-helix transcriptional regulator [Acidisphaera rubrifaciens]|uniref:Transcriptional regulator MarR n=1 Tax=Acidisphaera rubrifaciens HS-AP3 TaxID=1231350 RepID=A0A0D6P9H4_9PROT|nr:MarR family winged helix-turn-helix transcriptional regulator [Acidisphaera rubrifaciens]GAN77519.1 transcriptional regulator MarR [Acidisphaera rubrifaciens HS-AP3]